MEVQVEGLKKRGVWVSILNSSISVSTSVATIRPLLILVLSTGMFNGITAGVVGTGLVCWSYLCL